MSLRENSCSGLLVRELKPSSLFKESFQKEGKLLHCCFPLVINLEKSRNVRMAGMPRTCPQVSKAGGSAPTAPPGGSPAAVGGIVSTARRK